MVSVCLPSDALSQHLLSYLGYLDEEIPYVQGVRPQINFFIKIFFQEEEEEKMGSFKSRESGSPPSGSLANFTCKNYCP